MSKVAIEGNASGSGTLTIAAPNTNSNFTLSLPTNTGTIITQNSTPAFASTIGVGGATAAASGAGITFPATQSASSDANTLDDYEEGSWTMSVTDGTLSKTETASYTKIGRVVYIIGIIPNVESGGNFTGTVYVSGLPFTPNAQTPISSLVNYTDTATSWSAVTSSTNVAFYRVGATSQDYVQLDSADVNFFTDIHIAGCYRI